MRVLADDRHGEAMFAGFELTRRKAERAAGFDAPAEAVDLPGEQLLVERADETAPPALRQGLIFRSSIDLAKAV